MSESQVRKMINEGIFEQVALTGRVLITAKSFDRWKKGARSEAHEGKKNFVSMVQVLGGSMKPL